MFFVIPSTKLGRFPNKFSSKYFKLFPPHQVENLYTILQQIYSGNGVPNFVSIVRVL